MCILYLYFLFVILHFEKDLFLFFIGLYFNFFQLNDGFEMNIRWFNFFFLLSYYKYIK